MKFECRPKDEMIVIKEEKENPMYHLYCEDEIENGILIILNEEQARDLKEQLIRRDEL